MAEMAGISIWVSQAEVVSIARRAGKTETATSLAGLAAGASLGDTIKLWGEKLSGLTIFAPGQGWGEEWPLTSIAPTKRHSNIHEMLQYR